MWQVENEFRILLGTNTYINVEQLIVYKGEPLFTVKRRESDGLLGVDVDVYNATRKMVAAIRNGNIVSGDRHNYEMSFAAHHYTIVEKSSGRTICDLRRRNATSKNVELELRLDLYTHTGFHFQAGPDYTNVGGGLMMRNCTFAGGKVGLKID
jgi:hypothetical protein